MHLEPRNQSGKTPTLINSVTDEAWVVDFGGGSTERWVDPYKAGTAEEDLAAVDRLVDYPRTGEQYRVMKGEFTEQDSNYGTES